MNPAPDLHPHVYPTGDGERSTAGSNYGDWRPAQPPRPHGYDFESRFEQPDWATLDPDYRRLRDEHERELDAHYPHWLQTRYKRFADEFGRWREEKAHATTTPNAERR
ncbi:MAG TPA: hypothetical protein VIN03_22245 [Roseateles sp.]